MQKQPFRHRRRWRPYNDKWISTSKPLVPIARKCRTIVFEIDAADAHNRDDHGFCFEIDAAGAHSLENADTDFEADAAGAKNPFVPGEKFVKAADLLVASFCTQSLRKTMKTILRHDWLAELVLGQLFRLGRLGWMGWLGWPIYFLAN
jgi:hypothetical protein